MEKIIVIGGSAGSFKIVTKLLKSIGKDFPHTIIFCLHRLRNLRYGFLQTLSMHSNIKIKEPVDKESINPSTAYLCPANYHLLFEHGQRFSLSILEPVNHSRPSIDLCMSSAADIFREKVVGIILSGANIDGAAGLKDIKLMGGTTIVQDPQNAEIKTMPSACLDLQTPDYVFTEEEIIQYLREFEK